MPTNKSVPHFDNHGNLMAPHNYSISYRERLPKNHYPIKYVMVFTEVSSALASLKSLQACKVYDTLLSLLSTQTYDSPYVVKAYQKDIADVANVSKHCKALKEAGLILNISKGYITLNPLYVWKGPLVDRQRALEELNKGKE